MPAAHAPTPAILLGLLLLASSGANAQQAAPPDPAVAGVEAATQAYLDTVPPEKKARSDAYFEGGYWLLLWNLVVMAGVLLLFLHTGLSARIRDAAARVTRRTWLQPALYWIAYVPLVTLAVFPLMAYAGFFREHQYGLATQAFPGWSMDQLKGLGLDIVLGSPAIVLFYAVLRRAPRTWWIWGTGVTVAFFAFVAMIGPVYLAPVFSTYEPVRAGPIRDSILQMAHANGIATNEVWEVDASRQTTRISANVSGILGTERITLNDNLLNRASPAAVSAVMGHEIGHYVLNHGYELLLAFSLVIAAGFAIAAWAFDRLAARHRARWRVESVADPAGLPLLVLILTVYLFAITPVTNTIIRSNEYEADLFGLNAARQPDGFAEAALLLGEYRKLDPSSLEEFVLFDHPSGRTRIGAAMQWKAAQTPGRD